MDTIEGMRTFASVVSAGSFTGAADRLGMSSALVSKYIGQLEERLSARLLNRTTRSLSLTDVAFPLATNLLECCLNQARVYLLLLRSLFVGHRQILKVDAPLC